jgi:L-seryl-tRNA(Ser) seleniumtransferase
VRYATGVMSDALRQLPAVHVIVAELTTRGLAERFGRDAVTRAARDTIAGARERVRRGESVDAAALTTDAEARLGSRPALYRAALNATGVVLHTNLGRAPLAELAWRAMAEARGTCDLELDLDTGKRASRHRGLDAVLRAVTGAEAGLVVNNNAAAVLLAITGLAAGRPTAISRGHLVEIGGGFRLPTIVAAAGSPLCEIGTTNRTNVADYAEALDAGAAVILLVHRSNFVMTGYVGEPSLAEVVALGRARGVPVVLDLGSGALIDTTPFGLPAELRVQDAVAAGLDAICFSGDKLVGGPQAGLIVGTSAVVSRLSHHPLARALRCDKATLAGVWATLELYRRGEARRELPVWRALSAEQSTLLARAEAWRVRLGAGVVVDADDAVGGGSLPEGRLAGVALALETAEADALLARLRAGEPPVIGHIAEGRVLLHPRTVAPDDDDTLIAVAARALTGS